MFKHSNYLKKFISIFGFVAVIMLPTQVFACLADSDVKSYKLSELIRKSCNIAVGRVISNPDNPPEIRENFGMNWKAYLRSKGSIKFETLEVLKGEIGETFTLPQFSASRVRDIEFYEGETYLIIENGLVWDRYNWVKTKNDMWTLTVKTQIAHPDEFTQPAQSLEGWLSYSKRAFVGVIDNCEEPIFRISKMLKGEFDKSELGLDQMLIRLSDEIFEKNECAEGVEVYGFKFDTGHIASLYYKYSTKLDPNLLFKLNEILYFGIGDGLLIGKMFNSSSIQ